MAQHDYVIDNQSFPATRSDLNSLFQAIASNNSGATAPSTTYANQIWYDTANNKLYIRNEDNDAWIELFVLDQTGDHLEKIGNTITLDGTGNMSLAGDLTVDTDTLFVDASADAVGINATTLDASLQIGALNTTGTDRGAVSIKTEASGATIGESAIYIEEQSGAEGYYVGVNSDGAMFFSNSGASTPTLLLGDDDNVGIGTDSPSSFFSGADQLVVSGGSGDGGITIDAGTSSASRIHFADGTSGSEAYRGYVVYSHANDSLQFATSGSEAMRVDSSQNLLVATTDSTPYNNTSGGGFVVASSGLTSIARETTSSSQTVLHLNNTGVDGMLAEFAKDGTSVGAIGVLSTNNPYFGGSVSGHAGLIMDGSAIVPLSALTRTDNAIDLGESSHRFDDIFATNGTIQTSDQNEKQQIASLTDAEITAAKAISKLFKTFKWNDKVEAKGDNARTHAGVIAQDVSSAMTDAGLDATKYAFFCSDTWWETQTEVPAVEAVEAQDAVYEDVVIEAVLDDDGNEIEAERTEQRLVSEAVEAIEARDAYTRTDIYDTAEEAPEGATEKTRLGIRYPELLAFIGAATEQRLTSIETRLTVLEG